MAAEASPVQLAPPSPPAPASASSCPPAPPPVQPPQVQPPPAPHPSSAPADDVMDDEEAAEVVLFQIKECFVYKIPPRKSTASYRAEEWNINKWAWEGALRVVSKGDQCVIRLEDNRTGELFAQAPIWHHLPVPVEPAIDSSRFFVLRVEDTSSTSATSSPTGGRGAGGGGGGQAQKAPAAAGGVTSASGGKGGAAAAPVSSRHAFIGIGFRERPSAYDFQAAVYDHVKYLNKKKEAQEMDRAYQSRPAADYSLKEGQTLKLDIKRVSSKPTHIALARLKFTESVLSPSTPGAVPQISLAGACGLPAVPPPPGPGLPSPVAGPLPPPPSPPLTSSAAPLRQTSGEQFVQGTRTRNGAAAGSEEEGEGEAPAALDDDFGDFQAA